MAENDVFIEGGNWPAWATEDTQNQILNALLAAGVSGLKKGDLQKLIEAIGKGDKDVSQILKDIKVEDKDNTKKLSDILKDTNDRVTKLRESNEKEGTERDRDASQLQKSMENFSALMSNISDGLNNREIDEAALRAEMSASFKDAEGKVTSGIIDTLIALTAMANAANQFAIQLGEDRFNLVNEIRQSGLASTLNTLDGSLIGFSEMVNRSSFTLGQAAKFTEQFSRSVGGAGIQRSLEFVQEMAYEMSNSGIEGADMMRRFGLEFGGVAEVAGNYLDTVRQLGMLDRMNNQQLRSGMEDFMDTVTVTSNVLKIGITEAAEMIANTLNQRDDLTVMLAGLPDELRNRVTNIVSAMGAQGTQFGESIAMALSSTSFDEFLTTEQGQSLAGSNLGQEFIPLLRSVTDQIRGGADQGDVLASMEEPLRAIVDRFGESGFRALIAQNQDPLIRALGADFVRILDTIGDADDGNAADTRVTGREDSAEFIRLMNNRQQAQLTREDIETGLAKVFDYADNLEELNTANANLIAEINENVRPAIEALPTDTLFDATTFIDTTVKDTLTLFVDVVGEITGFLSDEFDRLSQRQEENMQAFKDNAGITERDIADREERVRVEREVGENGDATRNFFARMFTSDAERETFDIDKIAEAIERGNEIVEYQYVDEDRNSPTYGQTLTERRISTDEGMFDSASYMPIETPQQMTEVQSVIDRQDNFDRFTNQVLLGASNNNNISSSFANDLISLLGENRDGSIDYAMLADELGIDERYSSSDSAELEFVRQTLEAFANNNLTSVSDIETLITALNSMTQQLQDRSWIAGGEKVSNREIGERDALVTELRRLVNALNGN
jgi:hypothetical protein